MKQIQVYNTTLCDGTQVMENAVAMPISARLFPISNGNERRIAISEQSRLSNVLINNPVSASLPKLVVWLM